MKRTISILAITWAFCCTILVLIVIIRMPQFARGAAKLPFMKINPLFTGGDLNYSIEKDSIKIAINKPVFEALIGESNEGFVQITFSGSKNLPKNIVEEIDYNNDSKTDFKLKINTLEETTELSSLNSNVTSLIVSSKVKNDWIVRIKIKNENIK
jgi:hypothetical protein